MPPARRKQAASSNARSSQQQQQQRTLAFGPQNTANRVTKPTSSTGATALGKAGTKGKSTSSAITAASTRKAPQVAAVSDDITTPSPGPEDPINDPVPPPITTATAKATTIKPIKTTTRSSTATAQQLPSKSTTTTTTTTTKPPSRPLTLRNQPSILNSPPPPSAQPAPDFISSSEDEDPAVKDATRITDAQIKRYWRAKEEARIAPRVHQQGLSVNEKVLREFDMSSSFGPCIGIPRLKRWRRADGLGLHPPLEVLAVLMREESSGNQAAERATMEGLLSGGVGE